MKLAVGRHLVCVAVLGFVLLGAGPAASSPSAAKHIEQSLLGANATHWFYLEFIRDFPASYYDHTEILRVCSRRKSDGALVDSVVVSQVSHHRDPSSLKALPNEHRPTGAFDLAAYMRKHDIHLAADAGIGQTALVDSAGFHVQEKLDRSSFIVSPGMFRQLPSWTKHDSPAVRGAHYVDAPWNRSQDGNPRAEERYFVVEFGKPDKEYNWGRFVIYSHRRLPAKE